MARSKKFNQDEFDHQNDEFDHMIKATEHHFIVTPEKEKPRAVVDLSQQEIERRELQRQFKQVYGYKPVEKDLNVLRKMVAKAKQWSTS